MLKKLWVLPVDIRLAAHANKLQFRPRSYSYIGNVPVLDVFDRPIADWDVVMKWLFDKIDRRPACSLCALPVDGADRARHQARQPRAGSVQAEALRLQQRPDRGLQIPLDVRGQPPTPRASKLVTKDDPRVTRVGRFIRKTSLDELPQLFNVVLKGNLSLVGPRPHAVNAKAEARLYDEAVDGYFARHRVKPGITGWAQINGWRGETDTHEKIQQRVEHDLYYIENWSVLFDLYILAQNAIRAAQDRECVLITARDIAIHRAPPVPQTPRAPAVAFTERLLLVVLFVTVLASSVAFIEPSPHDALMGVLALACLVAGVRFDRHIALLFLLLLILNVAGLMALLNVPGQEQTVQYAGTSLYLAVAAVLFACLFAHNTMPRIVAVRAAYILTATIISVAAIAGYFEPVSARP